MSNIWIAASDGDLERTRVLVETDGVEPDAPDEHSYTPMHAAASWSREVVLRYLVAHGGDINVTDDDGETPLFVVETVTMAHVCIDLGADARHRNRDGKTAAEHHAEDNHDVASYLSSITGETLAHPNASSDNGEQPDGMDDDDDDGDDDEMQLDARLLDDAQAVLAEADRTGADPDEALREVVTNAVDHQVSLGRAQAAAAGDGHRSDAKRPRDDLVGR